MRHSLCPAQDCWRPDWASLLPWELLDRSTTAQSRVASDFASTRGASPPPCAPWALAVLQSERRAAAWDLAAALPAPWARLWAWVLASVEPREASPFRAPREFRSPAASARSPQI